MGETVLHNLLRPRPRFVGAVVPATHIELYWSRSINLHSRALNGSLSLICGGSAFRRSSCEEHMMVLCCSSASRIVPDVEEPRVVTARSPVGGSGEIKSPRRNKPFDGFGPDAEDSVSKPMRRTRKPSLTLEDGLDQIGPARKASSFGEDEHSPTRDATRTRRRSSSWGPGDFSWSESGGLREASFSMKKRGGSALGKPLSVFAAAAILPGVDERDGSPDGLPPVRFQERRQSTTITPPPMNILS